MSAPRLQPTRVLAPNCMLSCTPSAVWDRTCYQLSVVLSRYEGEFHNGYVNGLGQYAGVNGEVYRGEWMYGKRHG